MKANNSDIYSEQWENEIELFFEGLRNGKAFFDGRMVAVEIWPYRGSNDPRFVCYRFGGYRLTDDHFSMQHSRKLTKSELKEIRLLAYNVYGEKVKLPDDVDYGDDMYYESVRRAVRETLSESFDQFSDYDFASDDPYSNEEWTEDGVTGSLDGMWAFNGGYVDVKDDGGELLFKVEPREGNPFEIEGGEAERLKSDIETNIQSGQDTAHAIWTAVVRSYGDRVGGSAVRKAMNESMMRDSGRDMVRTMTGIADMKPVAYMYREDIFGMLEKVNDRLLDRMFGYGSEPRDYDTLCGFVLKHGRKSSVGPLAERVSKATEVKDGRMVVAEIADPRRGDTMYFVLER